MNKSKSKSKTPREVLDEHLLADVQLATDLATEANRLRRQADQIDAARQALNIRASYNYRRNSKTFQRLAARRAA